MYCKNCGKENPDTARFCIECGAPLVRDAVNFAPFTADASAPVDSEPAREPVAPNPEPPFGPPTPSSVPHFTPPAPASGMSPTNINVQIPMPQKNSLGTAGFVITLVSIVIGWLPIFGWILWLLGFIFSTIGLFKQPKGLAIAGFVISCFVLIMIIAFYVFASVVGNSYTETYTRHYLT